MTELSDTLIFYIISTAASITVVILGIVYKSKCKIITCCGCLKVERDIEAEERIDEMEINQNGRNGGAATNQYEEFKTNDTVLYTQQMARSNGTSGQRSIEYDQNV